MPQGPSGPLAGEVVEVRDRNNNGIIDRGDILEILGDFKVEPGASITVEDGNDTDGNTDNTQGTFVDGQNAAITETDEGIEIEVKGPPICKVGLDSDNRLTKKGVEVVTSAGVTVASNNNGGGGGSGDGGGDDNGGGDQADADTVTCDEFATQADAQAALAANPSLDANGDGQACEEFFIAAAEADAGAAEADAENTNAEDAQQADAAAEINCVEILRVFRASGASDAQYEQYRASESFDLFSADQLQECLAREVIDDPDGLLADTGGVPLLPIAALVLAGAGIFVGRSVLGSSRRD